MPKKDDMSIVGFVPAAEGWYVLEHDPDKDNKVYQISIVGWLLTVEQLAFPVSPEGTLDHMPDHAMMLRPDGKVVNRAGSEFDSLQEYELQLNS